MRIEETLERVKSCGAVVVVRGVPADALERTIGAIAEGGLDCIELSMSVRGALRDITVLKSQWCDRVMIGAGEVLNGEMATLAHAAQADFCSGVSVHPEMVRNCNERDLLPIPGALTPTEIQHAWHSGASLIKLFPAELLGPGYVAAICHALPRVELMPSGGVGPHNAADLIRAGAVAVCAGRSVVDPAAVERGDLETITRNAQALFDAVKRARQS